MKIMEINKFFFKPNGKDFKIIEMETKKKLRVQTHYVPIFHHNLPKSKLTDFHTDCDTELNEYWFGHNDHIKNPAEGLSGNIKLDDFCRMMNVTKNTVKKWIRLKLLVEGKHYIKVERVIRIIYSPELLGELQENFNKTAKKDRRQKAVKAAKKPPSRINWDY